LGNVHELFFDLKTLRLGNPLVQGPFRSRPATIPDRLLLFFFERFGGIVGGDPEPRCSWRQGGCNGDKEKSKRQSQGKAQKKAR